MSEILADRAARWLIAQHAERRPFAAVEPWPEAQDEAFAYAVQARLVASRLDDRDERVGGYKIGLTTPRMQRLCRGDRPISGVMPASGLRRSPAIVALDGFVHLGIESELAVRLESPLDAASGKIGRAEVAAAAGEVAAAFELIEDRCADYSTLDWLSMAADNSWHAGLVIGPSVAAADLDISDQTGVLWVDDREVDSGSTADVLGHPFDAVAWLAGHLAERGLRLEAGQWISTGSIATIRFPRRDERFRFEIAGLPAVELAVA
jgi:2-oxo-3-hexenedioate decarboxylase/2-keto-4-pentenoate hydratase